jgi:MFS transporter, FHS family, Na+ dependent glucose transporter 1
LGYLLGSLLSGRLYDRRPGHQLMALTLTGMVILMLLTPIVSQLWVLTGILLLLGLAESVMDVGGNTLLVWVHRREVGPYMNGLHLFFGIGALLSPILIAQMMLMSGGITWGYWLLAVLITPIIILLLRQPSPPLQKASDHKEEAHQGQINYVLLGLIVLFFFLYVGVEMGFGGWIYTYLTTMEIADAAMAAYMTAAYWGAFTVGRLLSIPIAFRVRPRYVLLIDMIGSLVGLGIMMLWPTNLTAMWVGIITLGVFTASVFPTTITLAERRMPISGQVTGWFFVGASLGSMFLPWLTGQLFEQVGPYSMLVIFTIDMALALGVLLVLISSFSVRPGQPAEVS